METAFMSTGITFYCILSICNGDKGLQAVSLTGSVVILYTYFSRYYVNYKGEFFLRSLHSEADAVRVFFSKMELIRLSSISKPDHLES